MGGEENRDSAEERSFLPFFSSSPLVPVNTLKQKREKYYLVGCLVPR